MLGRLIKKIFLVFITIGAVNVWASVNGISLYDRYELWASINGTSLYDKNSYELIDYIVENEMLLVITSNLIMQTKESSWRDSIKIFMVNFGVWGLGVRLIGNRFLVSLLERIFF